MASVHVDKLHEQKFFVNNSVYSKIKVYCTIKNIIINALDVYNVFIARFASILIIAMML